MNPATQAAAHRAQAALFAHGGRGPRRQKLAQSPAVSAAAAARRLIKHVVVTGVKMADTITVIQPKEFDRLNIDVEAYQRSKILPEVNSLVHVLLSGGEIPDPIDVAERPDGSWWIVDGQQRFYAHFEAAKPLRALIHKVVDVNAEARLFVALNSRRKLGPRTLVKGWPGVTGDFVRRMNTSEKSPMKGMIDLTHNSKLPLDATTLVKGILALTTGGYKTGDMATVVLPRTDAALSVPGMTAWAEEFVRLVAGVFGMQPNAGRVRYLPVIALALVAHKKWSAAGRPAFPKSLTRLQKVNWDTIVPTHAQQFLPLLMDKIEAKWK